MFQQRHMIGLLETFASIAGERAAINLAAIAAAVQGATDADLKALFEFVEIDLFKDFLVVQLIEDCATHLLQQGIPY